MAGPGRIHVFSQGKDYVTARLYNFDIEKHFLKPEHEQWLKDNVLTLLNRGGSMWLAGLTSRTGSEDLNLPLSRARADSVTSYLRFQKVMALGPFRGKFNVTMDAALGETAARYAGVADGVEDENWRAVVLQAWIKPTPPPPPPPPPPPKPPVPKVLRRTYVKHFLTDKTHGVPSFEPRADRLAEASRVILQTHFELTPFDEKTELIDSTWIVTMVTVTRISSHVGVKGGIGHSSSWFTVHYQWGPDNGQRPHFVIDRKLPTPMTVVEAFAWLKRPLNTYRHKFVR